MERAFSKVARDRLNPRALHNGASLRGEAFSDSVKAFLSLGLSLGLIRGWREAPDEAYRSNVARRCFKPSAAA